MTTSQPFIKPALLGIGNYLPEKKLTNADFERMVDTSNEWIVTRTGIKERRKAGDDETTASMGTAAAKSAIENAGISPDEIDLVIAATSTPDFVYPSVSCLIQAELGMHERQVPAFDITAACSGFGYGLITASQFIKTGSYRNILVVGAETMTRTADFTDRNTGILFGDGAGAGVVGPSRGRREIIDGFMASDGSNMGRGFKMLYLLSGVSHPKYPVEKYGKYIHMEGRSVFKFAVNAMTGMMKNMMEKHGLTPDDIGAVISHQANYRIIEAVSRRFNIPIERMYVNLDRYGNTSAASIPIALREASDKGILPENKYVILGAFGAGLTWTSVLLKW